MKAEYKIFAELMGLFIAWTAALFIFGKNFGNAIIVAALILILDILIILLFNRSIAGYRLNSMQERFSIKRIVFLSFAVCMIFWVIYGILWEVSYDLTTPPLSASNGYIVEHTVGIYFILSLAGGVFFSMLGVVLADTMAMGYAMTKVPIGDIGSYTLMGKMGIAFIFIALMFNIVASILPYILNILP